MPIFLTVLDFLVILLVVTEVTLAIRKGPAETPSSPLLGGLLALVLLIFGLVSMMGANGLTSGSSVGQWALLLVLLVAAGATRLWRTRPS